MIAKSRGFTKEGKEVKGWYCEVDGKHYIIHDNALKFCRYKRSYAITGFTEVIPETVGRFVCTDKNGNDVYAGDPVRYAGKDYPKGFSWDESGLRWTLNDGFYHSHYGATGTGGEDDCFDIELLEEKK